MYRGFKTAAFHQAGQHACGAEHLGAPPAGREHRPAAQTEEAGPQETLTTVQG